MPVVFGPPGGLDDFTAIPGQKAAWHTAMSVFFDQAVARTEQSVGRGNSQFFNPARIDPAAPVTRHVISWTGFPRSLLDGASEAQAHKEAEQLLEGVVGTRRVRFRPQDEYLEWHATRDVDGRLLAVDFTCEGPEYWTALAHGYPDGVRPGPGAPTARGSIAKVLELYRRYVSPRVRREDLLLRGRYDPWNRWNTESGAMHLTHPSNSLQAEIFLAADATVTRQRGGQVLTDADELIGCARYGVATRASDPTIGAAVNGLARLGARVSLLAPVGLYIDSLDTTGWSRPDGAPVGDYWRVLRGSGDAVVRVRYEVPASEGFVLGDIRIGGEPIEYAGQIAEHVTMKLTGIAAERGRHTRPARPCEAASPPPPAALAATETEPVEPGTRLR